MNRLYRLISRMLMVAIAWTPFSAQAAMVGTDQVIAGAQARAERDTVARFVARGDVVKQLEALGVSAGAAKERVDAMTQEELTRLAGQINSLPAGANETWLWVLIITLVVIYLVYYKK